MPHSWKTLTVSASAIPRLAQHYEEQREEHGSDAFFQQQLEGRFADVEGDDALFGYDTVRAAAERGRLAPASEEVSAWTRMLAAPPTWRRVLAVDPSGRGRDYSVAVFRRGPNAESIHTLGREQDEMKTTGLIVELAERLRVETIVLDTAGLGSVFASRLREVFRDRFRRQIEIQDFNAAWRAIDSETYSNAKSEVLFGMRARFNAGRITIPNDSKLIAELMGYRWAIDSRGRKRVIDPSPSPDRADALTVAFSLDLHGAPGVKSIRVRGL